MRRLGVTHVFPSDGGSGTKLDGANLRRSFRTAVKESGIAHARFHDLRHTTASRMVQSGMDLLLVAKILGHKTLAMVLRYAHHRVDSLRAGVDALEAFTDASVPMRIGERSSVLRSG